MPPSKKLKVLLLPLSCENHALCQNKYLEKLQLQNAGHLPAVLPHQVKQEGGTQPDTSLIAVIDIKQEKCSQPQILTGTSGLDATTNCTDQNMCQSTTASSTKSGECPDTTDDAISVSSADLDVTEDTANGNSDSRGDCTPDTRLFCDFCQGTFETQYGLESHVQIQHKIDQEYKCSTCSVTFGKSSRLIQHMKHSHGFQRRYECDNCVKRFLSRKKLRSHQRSMHNGSNGLKCHLCSKQYSSHHALRRHFLSHSNSTDFECDVCSKVLKSKHALRIHKLRHENKLPYVCEFCSMGHGALADLRVHIARKHPGNGEDRKLNHTCSECSRKFDCAAKLKSHLKTHYGGKELKCDLCNFKTLHRTSMRNHLTTHGVGPALQHKCEKCGKMFLNKSALKEHHYNSHSQEKRYKCDKCPRIFKSGQSFKLHKQRHKGGPQLACHLCTETLPDKMTLNYHFVTAHAGQQPFRCSQCDRTFERRADLNVHVGKVHVVEKCDICHKHMKQDSLKRHMKLFHSNSDTPVFTCDICGVAYGRKDQLSQHLIVHETDQKFECEICQVIFKSTVSRIRHVHEVHPESTYKCEICNQKFIRHINFFRHKKEQH